MHVSFRLMMVILLCKDRYFVKYHALPSLEDAGLNAFRKLAFDEVKRAIAGGMLSLINQEREGVLANKDLMKSCVCLFEAMGMGTLDVYVSDFESLLLTSSRCIFIKPTVLIGLIHSPI
jgi:cullin 1